MSNIIPPLLSNTPPPPPSLEDDEDDEFGDFIGTNNLSYGCENLSLPTSPVHSPEKVSISKDLDVFPEVIHTEEINFENDLKVDKKLEESDLNEFTHSPVNFEDKSEETIDSIDENLSECIPDYNSQDEETSGKEFSNIEKPSLVLNKPLNGDSQLTGHIEFICDENKVQNVDLEEDRKLEITDFISYDQKEEDSVVSEPVSEDAFPEFTVTDTENHLDKSESLESLEKSLDKEIESEVSCDIQNYSSGSIVTSEPSRTDNLPDIKLEDSVLIKNDNLNIDILKEDFNFDQEKLTSCTSKDIDKIEIDEEFDDFADFSTYQQPVFPDLSTSLPTVTDTSKNLPSTSNIGAVAPASANDEDDDDFGDFASPSFQSNSMEPCQNEPVTTLSTAQENIPLQLITEKQALEKAKQLFDELFPIPDVTYEDFSCEENERNSKIFELLKDVTDTPALSYQWPKSASQKLLLRALNIDERNILPPWNSSMPIFAYNMGSQPLEPTKTENQSSLPQLSPSSGKIPLEDIPSAQFDWKGSGLENPLDDYFVKFRTISNFFRH